MAQKPANQKLWDMTIVQAKARFATYPSPGASHWVHKQYVEHGGRFIESSEETKKKKMLVRMYKERVANRLAHAKDEKDKD